MGPFLDVRKNQNRGINSKILIFYPFFYLSVSLNLVNWYDELSAFLSAFGLDKRHRSQEPLRVKLRI